MQYIKSAHDYQAELTRHQYMYSEEGAAGWNGWPGGLVVL